MHFGNDAQKNVVLIFCNFLGNAFVFAWKKVGAF